MENLNRKIWKKSIKQLAKIFSIVAKDSMVTANLVSELTSLSTFFDENFYFKEYPDIAKSAISPIEHYIIYGFKENRLPNYWFKNDRFLDYIINRADKSNFINFIADLSKNIDEILPDVCANDSNLNDNKYTEVNPFDISSKNKSLQFLYDIRAHCFANTITETHKDSFFQYKNAFSSRDVVIVGTGATLNNYKPIKNAYHIGVNRAFLYEKCKMDFMFISDQNYPRASWIDQLNAYCSQKFYGILIPNYWEKPKNIMSNSDIIRGHAKSFYCIDTINHPPFYFPRDISYEPLTAFGSVIFFPLQFACHTNPNRIFLVGCDCSHEYFNDKTAVQHRQIIPGWKIFKEFQQRVYPDIEVISINPVGLKGIFHDTFTN